MAQTITTGFVTVSSGGSTYLDLRAYNNLDSARVRWKGKSIYSEELSTVDNIFNGATDKAVFLNVPSIPSGWTFKEIIMSTSITSLDTNTIPELGVSAGIDGTNQSGSVFNNVNKDETRQVNYTYNTEYKSQTQHVAFSIPSGRYILMTSVAKLYYWKYNHTRNPSVIIDGQRTSHGGSLTEDEVSQWYTLAGLKALQNNTIRHDMFDTHICQVEIEYTVSSAPSVTTQLASNVSYTSANINGVVTSEGLGTANAYLEYGETQAFGTVINIGAVVEGVPFTHEITGLNYAKTIYYRAYATNVDGTSYGDTLSFTTVYPTLPSPTRESPLNADKITDRRPYFVFTLNENINNDATKYHARVRLSEYSNMQGAAVYESITNQACWELWNGTAWVVFPSIGVDPNSKVRFRPLNNLNFQTYYWDGASYDRLQYGDNLSPASFRIMLSADGLYLLAVNSIEYKAYSLSVLETANGQIGKIEFELSNQDGSTNTAIIYGMNVNLAVNDVFGNGEEYLAKVRTKSIQNYALKITAITGSGILAERRIAVDYVSQDIGQTIKSIIDTYCSPLTTVNVNVATGISAPVSSTNKTPLTVLEELRRQHGIMYYVDKDWDMHVYLTSEISAAFTTVKHGGDA